LADDQALAGLRQARSLISGLVQGGVKRAVISPGSRSTALALACLRHERLETEVVIDERSAAFFALGLARKTRRPVVVIATSGSAPANWYPALIEAHEDRVPLVFVSADRPPELLDCGANQTTSQSALFGERVRGFLALGPASGLAVDFAHAGSAGARAADLAQWPCPGPVHVNVPFREPLLAGGARVADSEVPGAAEPVRVARPVLEPGEWALGQIDEVVSRGRGIIVCGPCHSGEIDPPALVRLAEKCDAPILADPLSGLRCGPWPKRFVVSGYDAFLRGQAPAYPDWVLQFGGTPVSATLQRWLAQPRMPRPMVVAACAPWPDPALRASLVVHADPGRVIAMLCDIVSAVSHADWTDTWRHSDDETHCADTTILPREAALMQAASAAIAENGSLFLGNSMVIRDADSFLSGCDKALAIFGNRGVSGVDGNVSTAAGIAAGGTDATIAIVGDVALFHDLNGLALAARHGLKLLVVNNGGGAIFGYLAQRQLPEFEQGWLTPPGLNLGAVAEAFGLDYQRIDSGDDPFAVLESALCRPGPMLIEMLVAREASAVAHQQWWRAIAPGDR
jgi:2-succinyl-5-enolpyruvyl-6-hydroxy-3-cyclohexene-1-carboxylate synthase